MRNKTLHSVWKHSQDDNAKGGLSSEQPADPYTGNRVSHCNPMEGSGVGVGVRIDVGATATTRWPVGLAISSCFLLSRPLPDY